METQPVDDRYDRHLRKKNALVNQIIDLRRRATKHKALLSLKYETLNIRVNVVQVSVIFFSTIIALLESLKGIFDWEEIIWEVVPIIISTYITLVMAILRFFKWEVQKENISKCHENHTYIINKLEKMYNIIINFEWINVEKSSEKWENIVATFEDELFDNFVSAKENFDTILTYKDIIHYKERYKKLYLKMEFSNQDIELIRRGSNLEHKNYMVKNPWYMKWFCCKPDMSLDVNHFLKDAYEKYGIIVDHDSMLSSSSASSYEQYDRDHPPQPPKDSMISDGANNNDLVVDSMVVRANQPKRERHNASYTGSTGSIETVEEESAETTPLLGKKDGEGNIINSLDETINRLTTLVDSHLLTTNTSNSIIEREVVGGNTGTIKKDFSINIDDNN